MCFDNFGSFYIVIIFVFNVDREVNVNVGLLLLLNNVFYGLVFNVIMVCGIIIVRLRIFIVSFCFLFEFVVSLVVREYGMLYVIVRGNLSIVNKIIVVILFYRWCLGFFGVEIFVVISFVYVIVVKIVKLFSVYRFLDFICWYKKLMNRELIFNIIEFKSRLKVFF